VRFMSINLYMQGLQKQVNMNPFILRNWMDLVKYRLMQYMNGSRKCTDGDLKEEIEE
jgi:hypothetical protein